MKGFRLLFMILTLSMPSLMVMGQAGQSRVKFTHLTNMDGLSQSTVQAIVKDRYGFLWFGTQDGLNRYDGYTFKVYRHQPKDSTSLRKNHIMTVYEDRSGELWVGTNNGALSRYDRKRDKFVHYREADGAKPGLSQKSVTAIYEDKQDNFWVGTYWQLNLLDRKTGAVTWFGHDPNNPASISSDGISAIFEDSRNNLWIGTSGGLNLFDRKTKKFIRFMHNPSNPFSISSDNVTGIIEDDHKRLWIGTTDGLNLFDPETGRFARYKNDPADPSSLVDGKINVMAKAEDGNLWIGTNSSLEYFETGKNRFTHYLSNPDEPTTLFRNSIIMSVLYDRDGILWVGNYQGGLNKYDKYLTYFDTYRNKPSDWESLSFNTVTSFAERKDGSVWVGTAGGALNLWNPATGKFLRFNPDPANPNSLSSWGVLSLFQSNKTGYLWIGVYGGAVNRYDDATKTFTHYKKGDKETELNNDAVYAMFEDSRGLIWMGTNGGGANVLDPATGIIKKHTFDPNGNETICGNFIRCFYEDPKGNIWIGATTGLSMYDHKTGKFTRFNQPVVDFESDFILSIHGDKKGRLWVGTIGGGLNVLDPVTRKLITYSTDEGLPDNTVNSILEDSKGQMWLSTNNGISCYNPEKNTFKNSTLYNGIQSFEFMQNSGLKTSKGMLLFGGVNGFNAFDPAERTENLNAPPVVITGFKLFNKTVRPDDKNSPLKEDIIMTRQMTLSYDQSIITFEFAALGFTAAARNTYSYKLEGFDEEWTTGLQRFATYTNLDPGTYTLKVKAANNDGVWSETPTELKITITPPFWLTWWFRIAVIALIVFAALAFYLARVNRIRQQQRILEQKVNEQTIQLQELNKEEKKAREAAVSANEELEKKNQELEQFVYIASHDLREPLRTTTSFVELFQRQYKDKFDQKAETYLSYITQASERMRTLINDLLDYSRLGANKEVVAVDCNVLLNEVVDDLNIALKEANAKVEASSLPEVRSYGTGIKQLFQNLIANGIKFRKAGTDPLVKIAAVDKGDFWQFSFSDNGIGIQPEHREKIFVIFQRLHSRKEYEGSGIGLAHCKKIVEQHKGKIWVESTPGEGSTFYFTILKHHIQ